MSRAPRVDPRPHLEAVAAVATLPGQPQALFGALEAALGAVLGHRLFTLMRYHERTKHGFNRYAPGPGCRAAGPPGSASAVPPGGP